MNHQLETNDHQQVTNLSPTAVKQKERSNVKKTKTIQTKTTKRSERGHEMEKPANKFN